MKRIYNKKFKDCHLERGFYQNCKIDNCTWDKGCHFDECVFVGKTTTDSYLDYLIRRDNMICTHERDCGNCVYGLLETHKGCPKIGCWGKACGSKDFVCKICKKENDMKCEHKSNTEGCIHYNVYIDKCTRGSEKCEKEDDMKCEHERKCINCEYNIYGITGGKRKKQCDKCDIARHTNFICKLCEKEDDMTNTDAIVELEIIKTIFPEISLRMLPSKILHTANIIQAISLAVKALEKADKPADNKPLTTAELEQMDGERVWVEDYKEYMLINVKYHRLYNNFGNSTPFERLHKTYRQKPSPRMVTIETAIEEKLMIRHKFTNVFRKPIDALHDYHSFVTVDNQTFKKQLTEPLWEAQDR